ncbi:MAG: GGDEF domain-containing protein [Lachnospiraceae bacterium]|nr:GGDEF domain-containing protein [Lachnospiraceae bacterium]
MARKKIGLFMNEISQFFQEAFGKALASAVAERDMDLIAYASYGAYSCPYGRNLLSEMGKKNIIHLPDYSTLDAIIALPNSFDIPGMEAEFFEIVKANATCPVICLQNDISDRYPEFYSITIANRETMYEMTKHVIDVHGCTDIRYMSGPFDSKDSPDRLKGFELAMEEAGLTIGPNTVFEGNYWINRGPQALDFFIEGSDGYPQAVICANDYMALSICDELKKRGKKVPEDVCVTGFDGIREGKHYDPPLTTVMISPQEYARAAVQLIDRLFAGEDCEHVLTLSGGFRQRQSCGCDGKGKKHPYDETVDLRKLIDTEGLLREVGKMTGDFQGRFDLDNTLSIADFYFGTLGCSNGYLCLCEEGDTPMMSIEQNRVFTDEMKLVQSMRAGERLLADIVNEKFDRRDILPPRFFDDDRPQTLILFPIHYKNKEYGYLAMKARPGEWPNSLTDTYINELSSAMENHYYQNRFSEFEEIKRIAETDPLTGLYNRRGFEKSLSSVLAKREREGSAGIGVSIASVDMDNLKTINDEHGHHEGDFALITLANTLKACIRDGEVCARFGGDEFSVILINGQPDRPEVFAKEFAALLANASDASGKPYPIHASLGISELKGRHTKDIVECMRKADADMYANKRSYKGLQ